MSQVNTRLFNVTVKAPPGGQLLMHAGALADPLNEHARALRDVSQKRKKSEADYEKMGEIEFAGGLYFDATVGPYVPGHVIQAAIIAGAKKRRLGPAVGCCTRVVAEFNRLDYDGPRTREALWKDVRFRDRRVVVVNKSRIMRTRAKFTDWSLAFQLELVPLDGVNPAEIRRSLMDAGAMVGVGDYRSGGFGRFEVILFRENEDSTIAA